MSPYTVPDRKLSVNMHPMSRCFGLPRSRLWPFFAFMFEQKHAAECI